MPGVKVDNLSKISYPGIDHSRTKLRKPEHFTDCFNGYSVHYTTRL